MERDAASPERYLASIGAEQRALVERIREAIRAVAPEVEETIGHGMLDYPGLANLAAQKRYVALYVAPMVLARHKQGFPGTSAGKSCLRFTKLEQADPEALEALLTDVLAHRRGGAA